MVRQLYLYSIEAADFPDSVTSENTLREFPLVIATVAKVSRKRGLWLVVRVIKELPGSLISHRGAPCAIYEMKFRADRPDQTYLPLFPYST